MPPPHARGRCLTGLDRLLKAAVAIAAAAATVSATADALRCGSARGVDRLLRLQLRRTLCRLQLRVRRSLARADIVVRLKRLGQRGVDG